MKSIKVKTSSQRAAELIANPEAYFASVREEARLAAHDMPRPDPDCEDPGIPEAGYHSTWWPCRLLNAVRNWLRNG